MTSNALDSPGAWSPEPDANLSDIDTVLKPRVLWAAHGDLDAPDTWISRVKATYPDAQIAFGRKP